MLGLGKKALDSGNQQKKDITERLASEFYKDKRHTLYLEYIKILCRYQPAVFVMENVKGMGSAKAGYGEKHGGVFDNICYGLRNPFKAMEMQTNKGTVPKGYKLYSLTNNAANLFNAAEIQSASECVIRSENYGVPQTRHRIIIMGVREILTLFRKNCSHARGL